MEQKEPYEEFPILPASPFDVTNNAINEYIAKTWRIKAAPKEYTSYCQILDERLDEERAFEGFKLDSRLTACAPDFAGWMLCSMVQYHQERGRSPVNTLISGVVRQGMGIGYHLIDTEYAGLRSEAETVIPSVKEVITSIKIDPEAKARIQAIWNELE